MVNSIEFYHCLAEKYLSKHRHMQLLRNDDVICDVARSMMMADHLYDDTIGSLEGFRAMYAKFAVLNYFNSKRREIPTQHIDMGVLSEQKPDTFDTNDFLAYAKKKLDKRRYKCLKLYFIESFTYREIAKKMGLSVERIRQFINDGLEKIKGYFNDVV